MKTLSYLLACAMLEILLPRVACAQPPPVEIGSMSGTCEGTPSIKITTATVSKTDDVAMLLFRNGITPDVESFSAVYALNPTIGDLRSPAEGTILKLPRVDGGAGPCRASLVFDRERKKRFVQVVRDLEAAAGVIGYAPEHCRNVSPGSAPADQAKSATCTMSFIAACLTRGDGRPIFGEVLDQISQEGELLTKALADGKITNDETEEVSAIARDMVVKQRAYAQQLGTVPDAPWPAANVSVATRHGNRVIPNLRILYVAEALAKIESAVKPFPLPSSPAVYELPEADYIVWAVHEPDLKVVSPKMKLTVRIGKTPVSLVLLVTGD